MKTSAVAQPEQASCPRGQWSEGSPSERIDPHVIEISDGDPLSDRCSGRDGAPPRSVACSAIEGHLVHQVHVPVRSRYSVERAR